MNNIDQLNEKMNKAYQDYMSCKSQIDLLKEQEKEKNFNNKLSKLKKTKIWQQIKKEIGKKHKEKIRIVVEFDLMTKVDVGYYGIDIINDQTNIKSNIKGDLFKRIKDYVQGACSEIAKIGKQKELIKNIDKLSCMICNKFNGDEKTEVIKHLKGEINEDHNQ